jgi:hypothetical protein
MELYDQPGPSYKPPKLRVKLKETPLERQERKWRKEQRRLRKESSRIYRANGVPSDAGMAVTPPRATNRTQDGSMSPPRKRLRPLSPERDGNQSTTYRNAHMQDWDESVWETRDQAYENTTQRVRNAHEDEAFRQKLFDLMADDEGPIDLTSGCYVSPPRQSTLPDRGSAPHVPDRVKRAAGWNESTPDYASMDDEQYAEAIRYGMWRRRNRDEIERQERADKAKQEDDALKARVKAARNAEEKKRVEVLKRESGKAEQKRKEKEIKIYQVKWSDLKATRDSITTGRSPAGLVRLIDMPWPVFMGAETSTFHPAMLQVERIRVFFDALLEMNIEESKECTGNDAEVAKVARKRILREAILAYHPDRFMGRYLGIVVESERDLVRDAIVRCSQQINEIAGEQKQMP